MAVLGNFPRSWGAEIAHPDPGVQSLTTGAGDLYAIFNNEIRANFTENVYTALGNAFQLDGEQYAKVLRALTSYDLCGVLRASASSVAAQNLIRQQFEKTERDFLGVLASLDWPKFDVSVSVNGKIDVAGPAEGFLLYSGMAQTIIISCHNRSASVQTLHLVSNDIDLPDRSIEILSGQTRYVRGTLTPPGASIKSVALAADTTTSSATYTANVTVQGTILNELVIVAEDRDPETPIARVRLVDSKGRYWSPEAQPSGLIRMVKRDGVTYGERWAYVKERVYIRVPPGTMRVSIRRGLEYRYIDTSIEIGNNEAATHSFKLERWTDMESKGWYSGDMHVHMLDPATALLESRAECLNLVNVMVFQHLQDTYAAEHFTGRLDPISDNRHFTIYSEEFRNEPMGHIGLINIKKLIEPMSTGYLGLHLPTVMRFESLNADLPMHGAKESPDYPLLLRVMKEAHKQGGIVTWAHLRSSQWEFPLDAEEHQIDVVDIMTHTSIPEDLTLWYSLLNCNFNIPVCAGTDRIEATNPIGHQRVYVMPDQPLTYESFMEALKKGRSFVTNGPMLQLEVNGFEPGSQIDIEQPTSIEIVAKAWSQLPFDRLEILVNGEVVSTVNSTQGGTAASERIEYLVKGSTWVAARCMGMPNKELFYTHPVFAHSSVVLIKNQNQPIRDPKSARLLRDILLRLGTWAESEAYFQNENERSQVINAIRRGVHFFDELSANG